MTRDRIVGRITRQHYSEAIDRARRATDALSASLTAALSPEPSDVPNSAPDRRSRGTGDPRKPESK